MFSQNTNNPAAIFNRNFFAGARRLLTFGLLALLIGQMLSVPLLAQGRIPARKVQDETVFVNPLAKNDPRAQLDPQLLNAQPMPEHSGQEQAWNGAQEPTVVEYDMTTGRETRTTGQTETLQNEDNVPFSGLPGLRPLTGDLELGGKQTQTANYLCVDDKQAKHNTWQYPWSTQVKLYITFPNGHTYVGSGTIIASKYVITHQNNVYYPAFGGLATRIEVIPGLDGNYKPFGSAYAVYLRYYYHGSANIGLLTLDRHIGHSTGWLGYGSFSDSYIAQHQGLIAGYPVSKDAGRVLYYDYGSVSVQSYDQAWVGVMFLPGEMGAGTYLRNSAGSRYVWGVSANQYYCSTVVDRITNWIHSQFNYVISNGL